MMRFPNFIHKLFPDLVLQLILQLVRPDLILEI
jgi:hypothetical protein